MNVENSFTIDAPADEAWKLLTDMSVIAHCLPGVAIDGEDAGVHTGSIKFKLGPVTAEYRGSAEFIEHDSANRRFVIDSKASDLRGSGDARALITAALTVSGDQTQVHLGTDLQVTGKISQFGRGLMQESSDRMIAQFASCIATRIGDEAMLEAVAAESAAATSSVVPPTDELASTHDDDQLDLVHVAGKAVAKRVVPIAVAVLVLVVILLIVI